MRIVVAAQTTAAAAGGVSCVGLTAAKIKDTNVELVYCNDAFATGKKS